MKNINLQNKQIKPIFAFGKWNEVKNNYTITYFINLIQMKNILIRRHAKSDWSFDLSDYNRPLNSRGKSDAPMMGKIVDKFEMLPDIILSSPAKRAATTARLFADEVGYTKIINYKENFYQGSVNEYLKELLQLDEKIGTALIVGHNPIVEELVSLLTASNRLNFRIPTATLVYLTIDTDWNNLSVGEAELQWILPPKYVKRIFYK